jgi:ribosomal protein L6P/L9E
MGFYHRIYVYSFSILVKFLSKTKIFLFGLSKKDLFINGHQIRSIRPIKIFTGRGIRFSKQIIYRKTGKVSSYR